MEAGLRCKVNPIFLVHQGILVLIFTGFESIYVEVVIKRILSGEAVA